MMPVKIEILENEEVGYNITVIGIGKKGKEAIRKYPYPAYGGFHWGIHTLTLCDDDAFRHKKTPETTIIPDDSPHYLEKCRRKIFDIIEQTEILFVIADMDEDSNYENAFKIAKYHKNKKTEKRHSILVNCSPNTSLLDTEIFNTFDHTIYTYNANKIYRPVEMLITDMYTQWIGIDIDDVKRTLSDVPSLNFIEDEASDENEFKEMIDHIVEEVNNKKGKDDLFNALLYVSSQSTIIYHLNEAWNSLSETAINGEFIVQAGVNSGENDNKIYISLMYGKKKMIDSAS